MCMMVYYDRSSSCRHPFMEGHGYIRLCEARGTKIPCEHSMTVYEPCPVCEEEMEKRKKIIEGEEKAATAATAATGKWRAQEKSGKVCASKRQRKAYLANKSEKEETAAVAAPVQWRAQEESGKVSASKRQRKAYEKKPRRPTGREQEERFLMEELEEADTVMSDNRKRGSW